MRYFAIAPAILSLLCNTLMYAAAPSTQPAFKHPGIMHTREDLDRIKTRVAADGAFWKSAFDVFAADAQSQADYKIRGGFEQVTRGPGQNVHNTEMASDANAAYQNTLMWAITADPSHAKTAIQILNAWGSKLKLINGHDAQLAAGLYGFKFINAAEIMRYTDDGWDQTDVQQFQRMVLTAIYPVVRNFASFANGNWDGACIKTMMAIGVFCDDRNIFNRAVDYYYHGEGDGRLTNYIFNDAGQCQESGRDQQHTQLGLGQLAEACQVGWNQGLDMYGADDNRLLRGFEYTARFNLGQDVPFTPHTDTTGKYSWSVISQTGRGKLRPIYEMVWNHYGVLKALAAPYTKMAAEKLRPEGAGFQADHVGFGTLLFTLR